MVESKKRLTLTIDNDVYTWLEMQAKKEHRPMSNLVSFLLRKAWEQHYQALSQKERGE